MLKKVQVPKVPREPILKEEGAVAMEWTGNFLTLETHYLNIHGFWSINSVHTDTSNNQKEKFKIITQPKQKAKSDDNKLLKQYWKSFDGNDKEFHEHEYMKHKGVYLKDISFDKYLSNTIHLVIKGNLNSILSSFLFFDDSPIVVIDKQELINTIKSKTNSQEVI